MRGSQGLNDLVRQGAGNAGGSPATDENGDTFKDVLFKSIEQVNHLQGEADAAQEGIATGDRSLEDVILATQKADTAFRALLAVRNKFTAAYEELKQIRV